MRDEQTMINLITEVAENDDRIRAVYMNGSRANPNADRDILMDYDVVFMVTDMKSFYEDDIENEFIRRFGDILYMQQPDEIDKMLGMEVDFDKCYGWLVIYEDGVRMDIHVEPADSENVYEDRMCRILLDKDGNLTDVPETTDSHRWVKTFSETEYIAVCNEFWWCLNNVVKGIRRYEIPYAQDMLNYHVRPQLVKMLEWKVGILMDYSVSIGKSGKYLSKFLDENDYELFLQTYCSSIAGEMWRSVIIMCNLFEETARYVAASLGYEYNNDEAEAAMKYLYFVKRLEDIDE